MNTGAAAARGFGARVCMPVAGFFLICQVSIPATAQEAHATVPEAAAAGEAGAEGTRFSLATFRCTNLAELVSCGAALNMKPNDPDLLIAEADVLAQLKRPGEAIGVYRNSLRRGASPEAVNPKIAVTQSQRHSFLVVCETQVGEVAESACESAWLPGAPDEVAVFRRRGLLLQSDDQLSAALDAYMAAARLGPRDRKVARAVVSLSASIDRKDASTLTARGAALMTLGHPAEAAASLREALQLAPDLAEAKARLRIAERSLPPQSGNSAPTVTASSVTNPDTSGVSIRSYTNDAPATRSN
jgi:tetratricopeptide (TPR) repeat protein